MDIKSLNLFSHLAKTLRFRQTAHANHVSPSTLSRIIQRMEEELDCRLLQRDNRSVVLTEAGNKLYKYALRQKEEWELLKLSLSEEQAELKGKLRIYCSVTAAYSHLPQLLDSFRLLHPQVEIMLETGNASDAVDQVKKQLTDFSIAAHPEPLASSCYFHRIAHIPLSIIAPVIDCKVQQQLRQKRVGWKSVPIILPEHGSARKRFEQWFRKKAQGKPSIYATVSGHEALVSMVALGCGIGISPEVVIENSPVRERVRRLTGASVIKPFELGLCCLKKRMDEPLLKAFLSTLPRGRVK